MALWQNFLGPSQSLWKLMEVLYWMQPTYIYEIEVCHSQVVTNAFFPLGCKGVGELTLVPALCRDQSDKCVFLTSWGEPSLKLSAHKVQFFPE